MFPYLVANCPHSCSLSALLTCLNLPTLKALLNYCLLGKAFPTLQMRNYAPNTVIFCSALWQLLQSSSPVCMASACPGCEQLRDRGWILSLYPPQGAQWGVVLEDVAITLGSLDNSASAHLAAGTPGLFLHLGTGSSQKWEGSTFGRCTREKRHSCKTAACVCSETE